MFMKNKWFAQERKYGSKTLPIKVCIKVVTCKQTFYGLIFLENLYSFKPRYLSLKRS